MGHKLYVTYSMSHALGGPLKGSLDFIHNRSFCNSVCCSSKETGVFLTALHNGDSEQRCCNGEIYVINQSVCKKNEFGWNQLYPIE